MLKLVSVGVSVIVTVIHNTDTELDYKYNAKKGQKRISMNSKKCYKMPLINW